MRRIKEGYINFAKSPIILPSMIKKIFIFFIFSIFNYLIDASDA